MEDGTCREAAYLNQVLERTIEDLLTRPRVEHHFTQRLFGQIRGRIERLAWHPT